MVVGLLGRKVGMTQIFDPTGQVIPVTVIQAGPCVVTQLRTQEKDGYQAVQLGFEEVAEKRVNRPLLGHFKRAGVPPQRRLAEFRLEETAELQEGAQVTVESFQPGELVDVAGTSKGKGFQGAMKRHGFSGGPATHGSMSHRRPGSGGATNAARVFKGVRKPGHMGAVRVTVRDLEVVSVDRERNLLVLKGAVPGPAGGLVEVTQKSQPAQRSSRRKVVS